MPSDLSIDQVLRSAGFTGSGLQIAKAIALAESGGNPRAYNGQGQDNSYGLFQINMIGGMGPERRAKFGLKSNDDLYDPYVNAKVAFALSNGGKNFGPWTTYTKGTYQQYMGREYNVNAAGGATPTGTTTTGGGAKLNEKPLDMPTLASKYGYSVAFFKGDAQLWALINESVRNQYTPDEFGARLRNTNWYQTRSESVRNWYTLEHVDGATAAARQAQTESRLSQMANQQGIAMDPKRLKDMAWRVNAYKWDDGQIAIALAGEMKYDPKVDEYYGGLATKRSEIKQQAEAYGISLDDQTVFNLTKQLVGQSTTDEGVTEYIKKVAKSKYQGLSDDIDRGITVAEYAQPYVESQARLLELNPADIHLDDPSIQRALSYRDPKTGAVTPMTVMDFESAVKRDPRWLKTKNARDDMMSGTRQILSDWGLQ